MAASGGHTVLVDGYNVIKRHAAWRALPLEAGRTRLAALAGRVRWPFPAARVILVFDSRAADPDAGPRRAGHIQITFASPSADAHIQDAIRSARDPSRLLIVTDDGDILRTAKSHGAATRSCDWLVDRAAPGSSQAGDEPASGRPTLPASEARRITEELARRWLRKHE
jgi:predicted RNA-binding protein with PIN domain